MDRREALKTSAILLGGTLSSFTLGALLNGCSQPKSGSLKTPFSEKQIAILAEMAEIIIPTTDIPGAKAAGVGPFIAMMVHECYPERTGEEFVSDLVAFEQRAKQRYHMSYTDLSTENQSQLMAELRLDSIASRKSRFFTIVRDLTILGYTTSEIGCTQLLEYVPVPGRYDGCMDYKPGDKRYTI